MTPEDPVEKIIYDALVSAGVSFTNDPREIDNALDFKLDNGIYIEVCQFYTPRKVEQCKRADNVILIQGIEAAELFAEMIGGKR